MAAPQYVQLFLNKKIRRIEVYITVSRVCPKKLCHLTRLDACTHQGTCPGTSCTSRTSRPWAPPPWPCPSTRRAPWSWGSRGTCHNPGQWPRSDGRRSIISGVSFVLIHCNTRRTNKYTLSEVKRNININWNKTDKKIYSWYTTFLLQVWTFGRADILQYLPWASNPIQWLIVFVTCKIYLL